VRSFDISLGGEFYHLRHIACEGKLRSVMCSSRLLTLRRLGPDNFCVMAAPLVAFFRLERSLRRGGPRQPHHHHGGALHSELQHESAEDADGRHDDLLWSGLGELTANTELPEVLAQKKVVNLAPE